MDPQILVQNCLRHVELIARTELQPTKKQKIDEFNLIEKSDHQLRKSHIMTAQDLCGISCFIH